MVKKAKEYINQNQIKIENQEYIFLDDLDIADTELCSKASGVVVTNVSGNIEYSPYLKCINYESDIINNSKSYIELNGPEVVLINKGTLYFDQGYTKKRDDIEIKTVGIVPDEEGAYTINYVVTKNGKQKTVVKRIVIVSNIDTEIATTFFENESPVIILKGEPEVILALNSTYTEAGFIAYDEKDGLISKKVKVEPSTISTDKIGTYILTYKVTNSAGKTYSVDRKVKIVQELGDFDIQIFTLENGSATNESEIEIRVSGDDFSKIILPDGSVSNYPIANYKVSKNGIYTFQVVDVHENLINKSIMIDNIDNKMPTGTCSVEKVEAETILKIDASDDRGIKSIDYILNGKGTGFLATTTYKTKEKLTKAEAIIKDVAGNVTRISCLNSDN